MAITDSQKVDYLFKKVGYSVAKTDTSSVKSPSNESIASPLVIRGGSIWTNSDNIPTTIPASNSSVVVLYNDSLLSTVQTTNDGTAGANRTWLTNLADWVDASFGSTYQVKVYLDTTGSTTAQTTGTQLFADGTGSDEWFFDYASGVLNFIGTSLPSVSFTGKSIFISGARYIGNKGLGNLGNVTFNGAITADSVTVAGYPVLTTNSNIAINGDVVGSGANSNVYVGLTTTSVVPGTYGSSGTIPQIIVDSKGRITYAANLAISSTIGNLTVSDTTISSSTGMTFSALNGNIVLDAQGTGIVQIIGTDAIGIPAGDTASRPSYPEVGYTRFNTEAGSIEYWDGTQWAVPGFSTVTSESIYPDGSANTFVLSSNTTTYGVFVSINGTVQQPVTSYNVHDDNQITFTEIPHVTDVIEVRHFAAGVTVTALQYGNTKVQATATEVEITGNLVPSANITYDLGSLTHWWKDLYLSGNSIYLGGMSITNNNGVLTSTVNGTPTKLRADDPVDAQDVVTLGYLQTQLSSFGTTIIQADDTSIQIIDNGADAGNIVIAVDGSNVATVATNLIVIHGNISANYIIGDGSQLTGLPAGYTDSNVAAYLPTYTGNISAEKITISTISLTSQRVVLGSNAGNIESGVNTISVGTNAGQKSQLLGAIAIGSGAGANIQNFDSIAIGTNSGTNSQGSYAIAIGQQSGRFTQGTDAVALGRNAGETSQGVKSTALGYSAGGNTQGNAAVAVGDEAGAGWQSNAAVAIGSGAGRSYQGSYSVALGYRAGYLNQPNNTIILNASGSAVNGVTEQTNSFYVNPIRNATGNVGTLQYNSTTKEVTYHTDIAAGSITSTTGTFTGNITAHTTTSNLRAYGEIVSNVGGVSGTANIDLSTSNIFDITLTNSTTFTFINHPPAGVTRPVTIVLRQPAVGGKTASFTGALYTDGTAPVLSTNNNAIDVLSFWSINGGTTFFGTFAMANVS